jgi:hypothetical protein
MRVDRFKVLDKGFILIDLDTGHKHPQPVGTVHFLETDGDKSKHPLDRYMIKGTQIGAISRYYEDAVLKRQIELILIAEDNDPTLDGIVLPITSSSLLTEHQKKHLVCGHLIKGHFKCERCALKHGLTNPNAIAVYPVNILPYSQNCTECGLLIFNIWQSAKGGPLNLFT